MAVVGSHQVHNMSGIDVASLFHAVTRETTASDVMDVLLGLQLLNDGSPTTIESEADLEQTCPSEYEDSLNLQQLVRLMQMSAACYGWAMRQTDAPLRTSERLLMWMRATWMAPVEPHVALVQSLAVYGIPREDVLDVHWRIGTTTTAAPSYVMVHDRCQAALVVAVRGTLSIPDVITDLAATTAPFLDGYAHAGIAAAARSLEERLRVRLRDWMAALGLRASTPVLLTGHSLGGALAAMLTLLLDDEFTVRCTAFGAPPVLCPALARRCMRQVTTIVLQDDIVPRLSMRAMRECAAMARQESTRQRELLARQAWRYVDRLLARAASILPQNRADPPSATHANPSSGSVTSSPDNQRSQRCAETAALMRPTLTERPEPESRHYRPLVLAGTLLHLRRRHSALQRPMERAQGEAANADPEGAMEDRAAKDDVGVVATARYRLCRATAADFVAVSFCETALEDHKPEAYTVALSALVSDRARRDRQRTAL